MSLEEVMGSNWFNEEVLRKVGNVHHNSFWKDIWVENSPLNVLFPRFYKFLLEVRTCHTFFVKKKLSHLKI